MQHTRGAVGHRPQRGGDVLVRLPGMNDHGQAQLAAQLQVLAEETPLHVPGCIVVEEIEPGLADRDDLLVLARQIAHTIYGIGGGAAGLVRMHARGTPGARAATHEIERPTSIRNVGGDRDPPCYSGFGGPVQHRLTVALEGVVREVAVAVEELDQKLLRRSPAGASSSGRRSFRGPTCSGSR